FAPPSRRVRTIKISCSIEPVFRPAYINLPSARTSGTASMRARTMLSFSFQRRVALPAGNVECTALRLNKFTVKMPRCMAQYRQDHGEADQKQHRPGSEQHHNDDSPDGHH